VIGACDSGVIVLELVVRVEIERPEVEVAVVGFGVGPAWGGSGVRGTCLGDKLVDLELA